MNLDDKKVRSIAQDFIQKTSYRNPELGEPYFVPHGSNASKETVDYWVAPFQHTVFEEEDAFLYVEDKTGHIMYVLTAHGRHYIDGQPDPEPEDDGEDWDDL